MREGHRSHSDSLRGSLSRSLWEIECTPHGRTVTCEARSGGFAFGRGSRMIVTDDAERDRTGEIRVKNIGMINSILICDTVRRDNAHFPEMNLCRLP